MNLSVIIKILFQKIYMSVLESTLLRRSKERLVLLSLLITLWKSSLSWWHKGFWQMTLLICKTPKSGNIKTAPSSHPPDQNACAFQLFNTENNHIIQNGSFPKSQENQTCLDRLHEKFYHCDTARTAHTTTTTPIYHVYSSSLILSGELHAVTFSGTFKLSFLGKTDLHNLSAQSFSLWTQSIWAKPDSAVHASEMSHSYFSENHCWTRRRDLYYCHHWWGYSINSMLTAFRRKVLGGGNKNGNQIHVSATVFEELDSWRLYKGQLSPALLPMFTISSYTSTTTEQIIAVTSFARQRTLIKPSVISEWDVYTRRERWEKHGFSFT